MTTYDTLLMASALALLLLAKRKLGGSRVRQLAASELALTEEKGQRSLNNPWADIKTSDALRSTPHHSFADVDVTRHRDVPRSRAVAVRG